MSGTEATMIDQLLTPEVMSHVDPAPAELGLEAPERDRESFSECLTWVTMFDSTTGPFKGVGGAAMTDFRLTVVHSPAAMLLFASHERHRLARLFGVATYNESVLVARDWTAFTCVPAA